MFALRNRFLCTFIFFILFFMFQFLYKTLGYDTYPNNLTLLP
jgi:hypothetical protein